MNSKYRSECLMLHERQFRCGVYMPRPLSSAGRSFVSTLCNSNDAKSKELEKNVCELEGG